MNIYSQVCGLIIILLLLYFYKRHQTMGLRSEQRFQNILFTVLICICLDIASCITIYNGDKLSTSIVYTVAKLYLCSLCSVAYFALRYATNNIYETRSIKSYRFKALSALVLYIASVIGILFLPLEVVFKSNQLYSRGMAVVITYVSCLIFILLTIVESIRHRHILKSKRVQAILSWMFLWTLAAIIQYLYPQHLVVGFASCAGMLIIFFEIENPEAAISRRTGHFSSSVIREYFDYQYKTKKKFSILMISFSTVGDSTEDSILLRKTINSLSDFLFSINEAKIFDTPEGYFILVFNNPDFIESTKYKINNHFQSIADSSDKKDAITLLNPFYTIVPSSNIVTNSDEMMSLLTGFIPTSHKNYDNNEVVVTSEIIKNLRERKAVEDMVVDAMNHDRVEVFYQPIYNVAKDMFTSAEALVRIRLVDDTLVSPNTFIPIVEETGRIIALSDSIYTKALSFMKTYHMERLGIEYIDLNLSVKQGESPIFATRFKALLENYKLPGSMINLEITETSSIRSKENMLNNLSKLEKIGVTFSLDDFGSGSSNLNYIIDMPVKTVKLDKTLTDAYFDNPKAEAIVKAVIEMSHSIGIEIIAEGIETEERLNVMKEIGVDYIQGYYFSEPLPERQFLAFIQTNNLKHMN